MDDRMRFRSANVGMGQSQSTRIVADAQQEYDSNPELRDLLARAAASPTVRRTRQRAGR